MGKTKELETKGDGGTEMAAMGATAAYEEQDTYDRVASRRDKRKL